MLKKHVAFIVECVYGHIVPTIGIAVELRRRGYRVSYAVKGSFERRIVDSGLEAKIYRPLGNKLKFFNKLKADGTDLFNPPDANLWRGLQQEEAEDTLSQLHELYAGDRPDLIIYDFMSPAGRMLAEKLRILTAEHTPMIINENDPLSLCPHDENLVLASVPRFFQRHADTLDGRFQFIGFIPGGREKFFAPWKPVEPGRPTILVSATTGLLPQVDFFRTVISALADSPCQLVLTIGDEIKPEALAPVPGNCQVNRSSSNFEILKSACLVIGQAGQGSALEAMYWGVPQLLIPPSPVHDDCAIRIAELGLGTRLLESEATVDRVRTAANALLDNQSMRSRQREIAGIMQANQGGEMAANLLEQHVAGRSVAA
jgi:UDP:flavonoid glycosyltransferase YjiC (YdhE family)